MAKRNCPNCAAPYDVLLNKCPYCGTSYFDMSAIDIDSHEPFYLKIKSHGLYVTQLVVPNSANIEMRSDDVYVMGGSGRQIGAFRTGVSLDTNITFTAVHNGNNEMAYIEKVE